MANDNQEKSEWLALARSNAALRCLCELQSRRSGSRFIPQNMMSLANILLEACIQRHERLVRAVELLAADLETIQTRVQLQRSLRLRANITGLAFLMAGTLAFIVMLQIDMSTS